MLTDTPGMSFLSRAWPVDTWRRSSMRSFFWILDRRAPPRETQGPYLVVEILIPTG
ncbi:hypothetical protein CKAH01_07427 [Colletotrichum kahawae]|uniref:Uncharacterized protein n=1 Tax=Colletotrichum kahawae TaxID=34407 RepID=A0AAD9Y5T4_COLKA|nr:hypothetical protein CKAH01_07427 [Colletotrichum kahawae]